MATSRAKKISAIIDSEQELEIIITELSEEVVGRQDISVQGSPGELDEQYGTPFPDPDILQHSAHPPKKEPFMMDDFGWVLGFSLGIPIFIFVAIGIFLLGDFRSLKDNLFYGGIGIIVGAIIGSILAGFLKLYRNMIIKKQEKKGGFVLWVNATSQEQMSKIIHILEKHHAKQITLD